jgi:peptide/nickel transport system permease protein
VSDAIESPAAAAGPTGSEERASGLGRFFGSVRRVVRGWNVETRLGVIIVSILVLSAVFAPLITRSDPDTLNILNAQHAPSLAHPFGTDYVGRDVLARTLYGARVDLLVVFVVTYIGLAVGLMCGMLAGYYRGWIDSVVGRSADSAIAFPFIILVLVVITLTGSGLRGIAIGIILVGWALYARLARSETLSLREEQFMLATRSLGYSDRRAIFRHLMPNVIRSCLVYSTVDVLVNLLVIASMSYLGFGPQEPRPDLGGLIAAGQPYLLTAWWITTLPGLFVVLFGFGVSLIGDGLSHGDVTVGVR